MIGEPRPGRVGATAHDALYARGVVLVMTAGCFWSLGGILIRNIEYATSWQIVFFRSIALALTLFVVLTARHRHRVFKCFREAGTAGLVGALCLGGGFVAFVFAMNNTTIANAVFVLGASPFAAALLARLVVGEGVPRATWIAMAAALAGVTVMVAGGIGAAALFGNVMALAAMLGFAGFTVALRRGRDVDMLPAVCLAGAFAALAAAATAGSLAVTLHDLTITVAMGVVQIGAGLILFTIGSRHVPAAQLTLLSLTELVLAPLLVWIGVGEVPSVPTLSGGAVVLAAVVGQALVGARPKPPPIGAI